MGILRTDIISHSQLESAGGSVEFDGSGDYLTIPYGSGVFHFTEDYTIDFYIKFTTNSGTQRIFGQRTSGGGDISVLGEFASNNFYYYYSTNGSATENLIIGSYGTNIELNTWHHVAIVSDGGVHHSYLDGVLTAVNVNNPPPLNYSNTDWAIGRQGAYTANEFSGSIYSFRITTGALYKDNFTVPKFKPKVLPGTLLLCCQSSTSVTEKAVSVAGDITSNGDPQIGDTPLLKEDITDTGVVFDGVTTFDSQAYMVPPSGNTRERNRGVGLYAGGTTPSTDPTAQIASILIQSLGNSTEFGDLSVARYPGGTGASSTRGIWAGGATPTRLNTIDFVTIANSANAIDFGDTQNVNGASAGVSNSTRMVNAGGDNPSPTLASVNVMDLIIIATAGNGTDFGDLSVARATHGAAASPTRGLFAGGWTVVPAYTASDTIDFVTIATTGNAQDFGNLTTGRRSVSGGSSQTRAIFMGGKSGSNPSSTKTNIVDFVTIASTGDATDFGDLTATVRDSGNTMSNSIRACKAAGYNSPATVNNIDMVTIATTGNAVDFGDTVVPVFSLTGLSDSHGGLS